MSVQSNIYLDLTNEFNAGELRAILSSGQAVVVHKLAVVSKDGDWIARETPAALNHILATLESYGAHYRFGAPLDVRWMGGGWSAHFDWQTDGYRARADFVTRPPRLAPEELAALWREQKAGAAKHLPVPTIDVRRLIELKKTDRGRDYMIIGDLARRLDVLPQLLSSQSSLDIVRLTQEHPEIFAQAKVIRPALEAAERGVEELELALFQERRQMIKANQDRLLRFSQLAQPWRLVWRDIEKDVKQSPLREAHKIIVERAEGVLPFGNDDV